MDEISKLRDSISNVENKVLKTEFLESFKKEIQDSCVSNKDYNSIKEDLTNLSQRMSTLDSKFITSDKVTERIETSLKDLVTSEKLVSLKEEMTKFVESKSM
jgi:hypothetical protein